LSAGGAGGFDDKTLSRACLDLGEELLLHGKIECESALSKPLFENAARLAAHRNLLTPGAPDVENRRNQFAVEMDHALEAINRLQKEYDRHQLETPCGN
jgi:glycerol-3-phosphate O-acyltransferase